MRALSLCLALLAALAPALAQARGQSAEALFRAGFADRCPAAFDASGTLTPAKAQQASPPGGAVRTWRFLCTIDGTGVTGVLIQATGRQAPEVVALPWPDLAVTFGRAEAPGRRIDDLRITGWRAVTVLPNPVFDAEGLRLIVEGPVPGVPDAVLHGTFLLDARGFRLQRLEFHQSPATLTDAVPVFVAP